jgi:hypothetical protein
MAARARVLAATLCIFPGLVTHAVAQTAAPGAQTPPVYTREADGRVVIRAIRITGAAPRIDGRLDDAVYSELETFSGFIQADPAEGEPATQKTDAYIFFDDRNVYVALRCWDTDADAIVATEMRRDHNRINQNDHVAVSFDTFYDGRNGFQFTLTAAGGLRDGTITDENIQADWNGVYEARAARDDQGWSAEFAIPFKTLRYPAGREQTWHIQLRRVVRSNGRNEMTYITPIKAVWGLWGSTMFAYTATLVGLEVPPPGLNLEIKPYLTSALNTDLAARPAIRGEVTPDAGVDAKYGITKSLTADFTYNTDFAQVEIDEAQVNLTRFNLTFPEKREFFLEGQGFFDFGRPGGAGAVTAPDAPSLFYSRRIGLNGGRAVPVIAGGRLTGRAGDWTIGAFNMETDDVEAAGVPQTNFTVARARRNILRRSNVGGIYTRRSHSTVGPGANDVAGVDLNLSLFENVYVVNYFARSRTPALRGDDIAYRSLFHYASDRYGVALDRQVVEPNFNPEVGFLRRMDFRRNFAELRLSPRPRNHPFIRRLTYRAGIDYITDNRNVLESRDLGGTFRVDFHSGDSVTAEHSRLYERLDVPFQIARDVGIPASGYDFHSTRASYSAGAQRAFSGTLALETGAFYGGDRTALEYRGRVDLGPRFGIEPAIAVNWVDLPQGRFTTGIAGARVIYTLSPRMFAAALIQHTSSTDALATNVRFRWEYHPGSELFFVYFDGRSTEPPRGTEALQNRGVIVKVNRLFRW